jgi:hypothetical protein
MATQNTSLPKRRNIGNKLIALVLWGLSTYATYQFVVSLAGQGVATIAIAIVAQAAFTFGESPVWRGDMAPVGLVALAIDTFTNIGGLFYYIGNLENSDSWRAFASTFGASGDVSGYTQLFLSIVVGVMLAAAPEALWKQS